MDRWMQRRISGCTVDGGEGRDKEGRVPGGRPKHGRPSIVGKDGLVEGDRGEMIVMVDGGLNNFHHLHHQPQTSTPISPSEFAPLLPITTIDRTVALPTLLLSCETKLPSLCTITTTHHPLSPTLPSCMTLIYLSFLLSYNHLRFY